MLFLFLACADSGLDANFVDDGSPPPVEDTSVEWEVSYNGPAYEPCVSDAQCGPGSACDRVPGYSGSYCAPACDPAGEGVECDLDGTLEFDTLCLSSGRCARFCEGSCPETLECQDVQDDELCAGEPFGTAGNYGTCSHPNVAGTDCPPESDCFGGDYVGTESGVCLPWCDDGSCPGAPEGTEGVTTLCYDVGFEHPMCLLLCQVGDSTCPEGQGCLDLGVAGLCAPEGAESPI